MLRQLGWDCCTAWRLNGLPEKLIPLVVGLEKDPGEKGAITGGLGKQDVLVCKTCIVKSDEPRVDVRTIPKEKFKKEGEIGQLLKEFRHRRGEREFLTNHRIDVCVVGQFETEAIIHLQFIRCAVSRGHPSGGPCVEDSEIHRLSCSVIRDEPLI